MGWQDGGSYSSGGISASSYDLALSSFAAGYTAVVTVVTTAGAAVSVPAGWAPLGGALNAARDQRLWLYWKRLTGADVAAGLTVSATGGTLRAVAAAAAYGESGVPQPGGLNRQTGVEAFAELTPRFAQRQYWLGVWTRDGGGSLTSVWGPSGDTAAMAYFESAPGEQVLPRAYLDTEDAWTALYVRLPTEVVEDAWPVTGFAPTAGNLAGGQMLLARPSAPGDYTVVIAQARNLPELLEAPPGWDLAASAVCVASALYSAAYVRRNLPPGPIPLTFGSSGAPFVAAVYALNPGTDLVLDGAAGEGGVLFTPALEPSLPTEGVVFQVWGAAMLGSDPSLPLTEGYLDPVGGEPRLFRYYPDPGWGQGFGVRTAPKAPENYLSVYGYGSGPSPDFRTALAFVLSIPIPPPAYQDRVRLTISKQASNVGRTGAIQFADYALSLTVTPEVRLEAGSPQVIGHALDPATPALQYVVKGISEDNGLLTYTGETILARLSREKPGDLPAVAGPFTGKQALEYILGKWKEQYRWLEWEPLPEFYLSGDTQMPTFPGLLLSNPKDTNGRANRKTMRAWLEDYFRVFEGYTFQAAASGKLRVVPPPWLDPSPRITLTADDFLQMAEGRDTDSVRNVATVTSQGLEFPNGEVVVTDEPYSFPGAGPGGAIVMAHPVKPGTTITVKDVSATITYKPGVDYLFYIGNGTEGSQIQRLSTGGIGASATIKVSYVYLADLPEVMQPAGFALWGRDPTLGFVPWGPKPSDLTLDWLPLGPTSNDGSYAQPPILDMDNSGQLREYRVPRVWPLQENVLLGGDTLTVEWNVKDWLSQWQTGDIGPYDNRGRGTLPLDGGEHLIGIQVFTAPGTDNFTPSVAKLWLYGRYDKEGGKGVWLRTKVWLADRKIAPPFASGWWIHGVWVQLNGKGFKLQKTPNTYIGRYGEDQTDLPGVTDSRDLFGVREEEFDTGFLSIPDTALLTKIARSKVLERLNPAQIVVAQVAPPFRVGMEEIGREFILPAPNSGTRKGILESLDYSEAHESGGSALSLTARFRVTENLLAGQGGSSWLGVSAYGQAYYTGGVFAPNPGGGAGGSPGGGTGGGGPTLPTGFPPVAFHWMGSQNLSPEDIFADPGYYQSLPFNSFIVNTEDSWNLLLGNSVRAKAQIVDELVQLQAALPGRGLIVILHKQAPPPSFLFDDAAWGRICNNGAVWASALEEAKTRGVNVMAAVDPEGNLSDWGLYGDANQAALRGRQFAAAVHPVSVSLRWLWLHGVYNGITGIPPEVVGQVSIPGWTPDPVAAQTGGGFRAQAAFQGQFIAGGIGIKPRRWAINGVEVYQLRTRAHFLRTLTYMRQLGQIITDPLILPPALAGSYTDWVATGASVSITTGTGPLPVNATSMGQALNNALVTADSDAVVWCYSETPGPSQAVLNAWAAAIANPHEV